MLAAIIVSGFLQAHNLKEQKKIEYKKQKANYQFVCDKAHGENFFSMSSDIYRCENSEVVCYVQNSHGIYCMENKKHKEVKL